MNMENTSVKVAFTIETRRRALVDAGQFPLVPRIAVDTDQADACRVRFGVRRGLEI
jgi:hypothetical protein